MAKLLLVTPDCVFYWPHGTSMERESPVAFNAAPELKAYLTAIGTDQRVDPQVFESVVVSWLRDLADGERPVPAPLTDLAP